MDSIEAVEFNNERQRHFFMKSSILNLPSHFTFGIFYLLVSLAGYISLFQVILDLHPWFLLSSIKPLLDPPRLHLSLLASLRPPPPSFLSSRKHRIRRGKWSSRRWRWSAKREYLERKNLKTRKYRSVDVNSVDSEKESLLEYSDRVKKQRV